MAPEVEICDECGFDGATFTDEAALAAIAGLPRRWEQALRGVTAQQVLVRIEESTWSIAEYADHVREVLFAMRFVVDAVRAEPGVNLGVSPSSTFDATPRAIDLEVAVGGLAAEALRLANRLADVNATDWDLDATLDDKRIDLHWVARHAVHDASHHLLDVGRVRRALQE